MADNLFAQLGVAGIIVAGLLYFISQIMKASWITPKHHLDVIAQIEKRLQDTQEEADFWKNYSLRRDDDLRRTTETTAVAIETAKKVIGP